MLSNTQKSVLQDQECVPFQEEKPHYHEEKRRQLVKVTDEVRTQIERKNDIIRAQRQQEVKMELETIDRAQRREQEEIER